jgi:hypothetical protein
MWDRLRTLDYIRIVGLSEIDRTSSGVFDVTFDIVYSEGPNFRNPRSGILTIRLSEFIDIEGVSSVERIASRLIGQVLMRGKDKDGSIRIFHLFGMSLNDWLIECSKIG